MSTGSPVERTRVLEFRHHRGRAVAGVIVTISLLTLLPVSGWFALLLLPPLVWTAWVWRAGTDADPDGLRVRALLGSRRVAWSQVSAIVPETPDRVVATLTDGRRLPLGAVRAADLAQLAAVAPRSSR